MKLTLDFNCIIALEDNEPSAEYLNHLLNLHDQNKLDICVPAISGIEKLKNGSNANSISELINRLGNLSKRPIKILNTLAYLDMWFLGYAILAEDELVALDEQIHNILFPNTPYLWDDFVRTKNGNLEVAFSKWKNNRCDVISMWCHIYHKNDIFITNDNNFFRQTRFNKLIHLGGRKILKPDAAFILLS
jgi:hypothetical protein